MNHYKLFVRIFAPSVQRVEELLTIDFLSVDDCTSLGCDCHPRISTLIQLNTEVRVRNKTHNLLGCASTDQSLIDVVVIDSFQQVISILSIHDLTTFHHRQLLDYNFGRKNVTTFDQLRSRNIDQNLTINCGVIHAWLEHRQRMFRSRSKEIAAICLVREELCGWEKVTLDAVMCLVKVYVVDLNVCCLNTRQRIVSSEDNAVLTYFTSTVCKEMNLLWICSGIVMSFTTMNGITWV